MQKHFHRQYFTVDIEMYLFHTRKSIHPFLFHIIHLTVLYNFIVLALTSIVVISCAVLFRKEFNSKGNNFF